MPQESEEKQSKAASKKPKRSSKRTKTKSKGLGDTVEKITEATGIKKVVEAITDDCGCQERKDKLNKLFPYATEMTSEQKSQYETVIKPQADKGVLSSEAQKLANQMYRDVLGYKARFTRCGSCLKERLVKLQKAYEASCES